MTLQHDKAHPTDASRQCDQGRLPLGALVALAAAGFLTMLTEVVPAGLLPRISAGLGVSTGAAGQLLSIYAFGAMAAAIPVTSLTRGWPRRRLLLATIAVVAAVNLLTAISPVFGVTLAARLFAGLASGVQWAMIAGYAMRLVPDAQKGRALAISMAGVPLALAVGVPLGTALGGLVGWRTAFAIMSGAAVLVAGIALLTIPPFPGDSATDRVPFRHVLHMRGLLVILVAAFAFEVGHMNLYTYIAAVLERAGWADHVGLMLLIFGMAALVGLAAAGALSDRHLRGLILGVLALFCLCMLVFAVAGTVASIAVLSVIGWGIALGAAPTAFQAACASAAGKAADVAQAMLVTLLNAGMAAGSALGGLLLGAGTEVLAWTSLGIFATALLIIGAARTTERISR